MAQGVESAAFQLLGQRSKPLGYLPRIGHWCGCNNPCMADLGCVMTLPSLCTASPIPLSLSPTPRLLWSERGRKFLEEMISSWPQYRDRTKEFLPPHRT